MAVAPFSFLGTMVKETCPLVLINNQDSVPYRKDKLWLKGDIQDDIQKIMKDLDWLWSMEFRFLKKEHHLIGSIKIYLTNYPFQYFNCEFNYVSIKIDKDAGIKIEIFVIVCFVKRTWCRKFTLWHQVFSFFGWFLTFSFKSFLLFSWLSQNLLSSLFSTVLPNNSHFFSAFCCLIKMVALFLSRGKTLIHMDFDFSVKLPLLCLFFIAKFICSDNFPNWFSAIFSDRPSFPFQHRSSIWTWKNQNKVFRKLC